MKTLGIDLGGTHIKYGVVQQGRMLESTQCNTPHSGYPAVLSQIIQISQQALQRHTDISHIGLSAPGLIDTEAGIIRYSNNLDWHEVKICEDLQGAIYKKVKIANDGQCATLGEAMYGAGKGFSRVAMLTIGTGVGGGFIRDAQLETDGYGSMAYIFGHSMIDFDGIPCNCGRRGCLEAYASASAIAKGSAQANQLHMTVPEIFAATREGNVLAGEIIQEFIKFLSEGIVNIANILRPQIIIIGGGVCASADLIIPAVDCALQKGVYGYSYAPVKVAQAALGNTAGIVGAANL